MSGTISALPAAGTIQGSRPDTLKSPSSPIETLLRELVAEVKGLRSDLARVRRPSHLTRPDRDRLASILPAIAGAIGSDLFVVRELFEHDVAGLRLVLADLNAKQLGRLLQRADGEIVGGFTVQRDGSECGAVLWRVLETL